MAPSEEPSSASLKRPRAESEDSSSVLLHDDYTIGWVCALPIEMAAAEAMLDQIHDPLPHRSQDSNAYTLGNIGPHNIAIACLPKGHYGTINAATVANNMVGSFPSIKHGLMVGIGGGVPGSADIRLGDIVVSTEVVQYDLGKAMPGCYFHRTGYPVRPPQPLMTAVSKLQASHDRSPSRVPKILVDMLRYSPEMAKYAHPMIQDRLFRSNYLHGLPADGCDACDQSQLIHRDVRKTLDPKIHYGRIASGNQVIKDADTRDKLAKELGSICFEMEAAGLMDSFPCLAIRGICDYSDSHKNKQWQEYAAAVAAAYAKELLLAMPAHRTDISTGMTTDDRCHALQHLRAKRPKTQRPHKFDSNDGDADKCLQSLFITDPSRDRDDIIDAKGDICEGTCEWILSAQEFKTWDQNPPHLLWISAPPGRGKTYMSIYLSQHFERVVKDGAVCLYFFCDNKHATRNTAANVLRGLLYQLILHQRDLIYTILPHWKIQSSSLFQENSFNTLWELFKEMVNKLEANNVYCVIDGLDECEGTSLSILLRKFERLSRNASSSKIKMKLICLSRRFPERIPESLLRFLKIELDTVAAGKEDVQRFISQRVLELSRKKNIGPNLRHRIEETFREQSEDTFLWVSFMAQNLDQKCLWEIETALKELPRGLDAVYERILSQITLDNLGAILKMLRWILVAKRPLRVPELCEAANVEATELVSREEVCLALIRSCGHFLQTTWNRESFWHPTQEGFGYQAGYDSESEPESDSKSEPKSDEPGPVFRIYTRKHSCFHSNELYEDKAKSKVPEYWPLEVTFVHQSARDYLVESNKILIPGTQNHTKQQLNEYVADRLVAYLSNGRLLKPRKYRPYPFSTAQDTLKRSLNELPLASYAVKCWYLHFRELDDVSQIIQQNQDFFSTHSKTREAWHKYWRPIYDDNDKASVPLLHMSSLLNLYNLAKWCLGQRQTGILDVTWGTGWGRTALHEACSRGWEHIANLLLDAGADVLARDKHDRTAFEHALGKCGRDLLRRMASGRLCTEWLTREVGNSHNNFLEQAAESGNDEACRFIVEELAWDVNCHNPVIPALKNGHLELARTLVFEWHAHIDHWMMLRAACGSSNRSPFQQLIQVVVHEFSVSVNATDPKGCNILCTLNHGGWDWKYPEHTYSIMETVLRLGCNPGKHNHKGRTPLHCAADTLSFPFSVARAGLLELMLRYGRLSINEPCQDARTLLHYFMHKVASLNTYDFPRDQPLFHKNYLRVTPVSLKRLLDLGVDRHIRDKQGYTALDLLRRLALDRDMEIQKSPLYQKMVNEMVILLESYATVAVNLGGENTT